MRNIPALGQENRLAIEALEKLEAITEWILGIETAKAGNLAVLHGGHPGSDQPLP